MLQGYEYVRVGQQSALVRGESAETVLHALLENTDTSPDNRAGRGTTLRFPLADGGAGIIREYRRGGLLYHVNSNAYLSNRPLRELRVADYLWNKGFRIPEPLGICWWRRAGLFYGRYAARALAAVHVQEYLETNTDVSPETCTQVGEIIREMHKLGVFHADLQVRNILLAQETPYLIDFDNARRFASLSSRKRARNLFRLRRSFEKNGIDLRWYEMILAGYGDVPRHPVLSFVYSAKSRLSGQGSRK